MNLTEMIESVAKNGNGGVGCTKKVADQMVRDVLNAIEEGLVKDGHVRIGELGTLKTVKRAARQGRNPRTKETIEIPEKNTAVFRVSKLLSLKLNG